MTAQSKSEAVSQQISDEISQSQQMISDNLAWLRKEMHPFFFILNQSEIGSLSLLTSSLHKMEQQIRIVLQDSLERTMIAQLDTQGSLYHSLRDLSEKDISYAEITTSNASLPNSDNKLEVLRLDYQRKQDSLIAEEMGCTHVTEELYESISQELKDNYPEFAQEDARKLITMLLCNNAAYIEGSPAKRIARVINLYAQTEANEGVFLDVQGTSNQHEESRVLFGMANPPTRGYLLQLFEVFNRLGMSVHRSYSLTLSNGVYPYFLSTFYVQARDGSSLIKGGPLFARLQREIYNTQILSRYSPSYKALLEEGVTTGIDASLMDAVISFCHTNLAHNHPDSYSLEGVMRSFHNQPEITTQLVELFHARFSPEIDDREALYQTTLAKVTEAIESFNTGRKFLDQFRKTVFQCALSFVKHTLKTNFFVSEKHALAFRLDPCYLEDLGEEFTEDLPADRPFRITFFFGRNGSGYHIGFSDIARGGWRTNITQGRDNYIVTANTMFKENYVLAHTQHLKNKDIYEGGSKMVAVLRADTSGDAETIRQHLYKLQFGFINAFFDLFVTENGKAKDPRVIDYYGEDEPIELGPDENMHDVMVELIAKQGKKRGYLLGAGVISSKQVGINHKDYGVTSLGVIRFAEVTMQETQGIDMHKDAFSVKFTGGPNGDVAGNGMRLLLERCPQVKIKLIIDGTGALYDPEGLDHDALSKIILSSDLDAYDTSALHPGGFLLYRQQTRKDGMRELYKKSLMLSDGLQDQWVSTDSFYKSFNTLMFTVEADLFIPAGGRPESIDISNVDKFFSEQGETSGKVIIEGANSFITPDARLELQRRGVVIMRDASANKCGVISSSYEIIANLMLSDDEFLQNKKHYVSDVLVILNQMAEREARLIIKRHRESNGSLCYTEISNDISREINDHYAKIFDFFQNNPEQCHNPDYMNAILLHMPHLIGSSEHLRNRVTGLPQKVKFAILASKIASAMVYEGDVNSIYGGMVEAQVARFPAFS